MGGLLLSDFHAWKPGDYLRADWLNGPVRAARAARVRGDNLGVQPSRAGVACRRTISRPIVARLTGSSSPYSFVQLFENSDATWSDGPRTGTAYEVNGVSGLGGTRHRIYPDRFGGHRFQSIRHGTGDGRGQLLGCVCPSPPATLYLKVISGGCSLFDDCTLEWGPTPSGLAPLSLGTNSYLSTATFTDDQTGDSYYWFLSCFSSIVRISRVFETSIFGSPFLDSVAYFWTFGFSGNTCNPFSLTNGTDFAGGTCVLYLEETP